MKVMFTLTVFETLLFEAKSVLWPAQWVTGSESVKVMQKSSYKKLDIAYFSSIEVWDDNFLAVIEKYWKIAL